MKNFGALYWGDTIILMIEWRKNQKRIRFGVLNVADIRDTTMINKSVGYQGKINSKKYLVRM